MASTLDALFNDLQKSLADSPMTVGPVVTRVLLRTGVNLKAARPEQQNDPAVVSKVRGTLLELGYAL